MSSEQQQQQQPQEQRTPDAVMEAVNAILEEMEVVGDQFSLSLEEREMRLKELQTKVLALANEFPQQTRDDRALSAYWRGAAVSLMPGYHKAAEKHLSQAIKLQPKMVEAWNMLGRTYWKKKDISAAQNCFSGALKQKKNKDSLRRLSVVLRSVGVDAQERAVNVKQSLDYAKQAVAMDVTDGYSWYLAGNAYMSVFFTASRVMDDLQNALKAYERAESSKSHPQNNNPDLYWNRGNIFGYWEDYGSSVENYRRAAGLDPSLKADEQIENTQRFFHKMCRLVSSKAGLKGKKLKKATQQVQKLHSSEKHAGKKLSELSLGQNADVCITARVVAPVSRESGIPTSFVVMDCDATVMVLSLYNVTANVLDTIKVNSEVVVFEPEVKRVTMLTAAASTTSASSASQGADEDAKSDQPQPRAGDDGASAYYDCIQLRQPNKILINGKMLAPSNFALPYMTFETFT